MKKTEKKHNMEPADPGRRDFMQMALKALGGLALLEVGAVGTIFLVGRNLEGKFGGIITAGKVSDFTLGTVVEFTEGNFYLVRTQDGGFMAIYRRCPHLGCTVNWNPEKERFYCPCHSASFDRNGEYQSQMVSRSLDTFPVLFENGLVKVDTSQLQTRVHHQPSNVAYYKQENAEQP